MGRNTVLGEHMEQKEFCELQASDAVMSRNEYGLFRKPVYHDQDGCEASRRGELLYEVHQDGIPGLLQYGKLLQQSIGPMAQCLSSCARGTGPDIVLDEGLETRPSILMPD